MKLKSTTLQSDFVCEEGALGFTHRAFLYPFALTQRAVRCSWWLRNFKKKVREALPYGK